MAEQWRISRSSRVCVHSGEPIDAAQPFFSALVEKDEGWDRLDFTVAAWPDVDKERFFSYWKNKGCAPDDRRRQKVDHERLLSFFDSLENSGERRRRLFRYVLALILCRGGKRLLRLDDVGRTPDGDRLTVFDRRTSRTLEIVSPEATREELAAVQLELNRLFDMETDGE